MTAASIEDTVAGILTAARLTLSETEREKLVADYPTMRAAADAMYLPELEDREPAVRFDPTTAYRTA